MKRLIYNETQWSDIFYIVATTDSPFQCAKTPSAYLAELRTNGMTVTGCVDIEGDADPAVKSTCVIGTYITISDGVPASAPNPEPVAAPSRLDVLMATSPATAADKTELLGLLQTKLADTENLTWSQMNKMLALERES